jgi:hypothetical protein
VGTAAQQSGKLAVPEPKSLAQPDAHFEGRWSRARRDYKRVSDDALRLTVLNAALDLMCVVIAAALAYWIAKPSLMVVLAVGALGGIGGIVLTHVSVFFFQLVRARPRQFKEARQQIQSLRVEITRLSAEPEFPDLTFEILDRKTEFGAANPVTGDPFFPDQATGRPIEAEILKFRIVVINHGVRVASIVFCSYTRVPPEMFGGSELMPLRPFTPMPIDIEPGREHLTVYFNNEVPNDFRLRSDVPVTKVEDPRSGITIRIPPTGKWRPAVDGGTWKEGEEPESVREYQRGFEAGRRDMEKELATAAGAADIDVQTRTVP